MTQLTVWGEAGSSALVKREDLFNYHLQVDWADDNRWRESRITLPGGMAVPIDRYVGANFKRPRTYHPEYALALELLIANAVVEAKERGFRVAAVELGVWAFRTLKTMGKRVTKIGLHEPMLMEDGRTKTYDGYQWVDQYGEGVLLVPWGNGDQLVRLKDSRGYYVVPVDERTADRDEAGRVCEQTMSWRRVKDYPQLSYEEALPWVEVPLLESGDEMIVSVDCEDCGSLVPVKPWRLSKDIPSGKRVCRPCKERLEHAREEARLQGWDYDKRKPIPKRRSFVQTLVNPNKCPHKFPDGKAAWGMQMQGTSNAAVPAEKRSTHGMKTRYECILCGAPTPEHLLSDEQKQKLSDQSKRRD